MGEELGWQLKWSVLGRLGFDKQDSTYVSVGRAKGQGYRGNDARIRLNIDFEADHPILAWVGKLRMQVLPDLLGCKGRFHDVLSGLTCR